MTKVTSIGFDYGVMATNRSCIGLVGPRPFGVHCKHRGVTTRHRIVTPLGPQFLFGNGPMPLRRPETLAQISRPGTIDYDSSFAILT